MSDESDSEPQNKRKRKNKCLEFQEEFEFDNIVASSDSDSGSSIELSIRKKVLRVFSDSDSSDSGSSIGIRHRKKVLRVSSDSDSSDSDLDISDHGFEGSSNSQCSLECGGPSKVEDTGMDSDSSSGQSEKCPICLLGFKSQEIGIPESCHHTFCTECILEWSKTMNTCPVDRREFSVILVRPNLQGKIIRQIPVQPPNPQQNHDDIVEDPTFCQICGSSEREDRMLLCDGCDLGFHMHCLMPPLNQVPNGDWYCSDCSPEDVVDAEIQMYEIELLLNDAENMDLPLGGRRRRRSSLHRMFPRTRQSERIRRTIANNRLSLQRTETVNHQIVTESPTNSLSNMQQSVSSTSQTKRKPTKKKRKKTRRKRYKIIYKIDEATGETIVVRKKKRSYKTRRKAIVKRKRNKTSTPKSVKKRLALQLGVCPLRTASQTLPEVRVQPQSTITNLRHNAGIPTLHLFGQRNELNYFSGSEDEISPGLLTRRAPNHSDILALRRTARVKEISLPNSVSSSTDILGDILNNQTKLHSKNAVFSLGENGKLNIKDPNKKSLNNFDKHIKKQPLSNDDDTNDNRPSSSNSYQNNTTSDSFRPTSTVVGSSINNENTSNYSGNNSNENDENQQINLSSSFDLNVEKRQTEKKSSNKSRSNSPNSNSDLDIYSDIETVSTSKVDESKAESPIPNVSNLAATDDDNNDSEPDMVIDTDKNQSIENEDNTREETIVTSTVIDSNSKSALVDNVINVVHSTSEIQSEAIQSSNQEFDDKTCHNKDNDDNNEEDENSDDDGCPNFSIYSKESITLAKNTDISLNDDSKENNQVDVVSSSPATYSTNNRSMLTTNSGLYSDSEDESIVKKLNVNSTFVLTDICNMTEDISEEERSYTPCLDERPIRDGIEGLDTEMISDEERNDFDESHDLKTASDGDALEINAKESELDFTRPEDYEEGEIVDKSKQNKTDDKQTKTDIEKNKKEPKKKDTDKNDKSNKENETQNKESKFKRLSKNTKERNYRDKDREDSVSRDKKQDKDGFNKKDKRKEKRKEIERYDVRALIADKPRRLKDKFGRDIRRSDSRSRSRSFTPNRNRPSRSVSKNRRSSSRSRRSLSKHRSVSKGRRSSSKGRRSLSKDRLRKKRGRSRQRRSVSRSKSKSVERKRSKSKTKKRKRSISRERRRKSTDRLKTKASKRHRSPSRSSFTPKRRKEWSRKHSKEWTPSLSRSPTPEQRHLTPSWTPPRLIESATVKPHNLTVILPNDSRKKKKEKKKKSDKKVKENDKQKKKKNKDKERDRSPPPPSKEVFASGDNILVSVSFNKENETRDVSTSKRKKETSLVEELNKKKKNKRSKLKAKRLQTKDLSGIKPVAIIDLDRSPFKELTPSPKDVIVLTDSDNEEVLKTSAKKNGCDSSSQAKSPERNNYLTGPKTPPEPQVKFTLSSKPQQLRAITNPLHEPDDLEQENDLGQEQINDHQRLDSVYKGPNTPPEPPNSPPSSPDAYDPFEPTKSRSATPDPMQKAQSNSVGNLDNNHDDSMINNSESMDKSNASLNKTPDNCRSHTPPLLADVQPADSQSSIHATPESTLGKSPERTVNNQTVQLVPAKPVNQIAPFSAVPTSLIISTPTSSSSNSTNSNNSRINILNSTILTPLIQQRVALPTKTNSAKTISPTKASVKSQPIKIPIKNPITRKHSNSRNNPSASDNNDLINLDSPYSPGSSDYEDLFEPPSEATNISKANVSKPSVSKPVVKSPAKIQNAFDALFGSPFNKTKPPKNDNNKNNSKFKKTPVISTSSKQIGVKLDEDNLKILDDLPNSAVEMQVKDKFLKKLNRQERVVEEVKLVLKPHYNKKHINKEEYKDILRRAVPKICHNKSGEINPTKIKNLVEAYVKKIRHSKKVTSSSSINSQKI